MLAQTGQCPLCTWTLDTGEKTKTNSGSHVSALSRFSSDDSVDTARTTQTFCDFSHTSLLAAEESYQNMDRFNDYLTKQNVFIETDNSTCIAVVRHFNVNLAKQTMFGGILQNYCTDNSITLVPPEIHTYVGGLPSPHYPSPPRDTYICRGPTLTTLPLSPQRYIHM